MKEEKMLDFEIDDFVRFIVHNDKTCKIIYQVLFERIKTVIAEDRFLFESFLEVHNGSSKIKNRH